MKRLRQFFCLHWFDVQPVREVEYSGGVIVCFERRLSNLSNGRSITAIVTDRGPYIKGRCVDLGRAGANAIGMGGLARVRVE